MAPLQTLYGLTSLRRSKAWSGTRVLSIQINQISARRPSRRPWNSPGLQFKHASNSRDDSKPGDKLGSSRLSAPQFPKRQPGTIVHAIIAACVGIWGYLYYQGTLARRGSKEAQQNLANFNKHGVLSLRNIREGRYYTLLTHTFVHMEPMHLLANMVTLWSFGPPIAVMYGVPAFCGLWVGSGVVGATAQAYYWAKYKPGASAVGASGSVLGILGALTIAMPKWRILIFPIPFPIPLFVATVAEVAFSLAALRNGWLPYFGHVDHLAGTAFGALWYLTRRRF